MVLKLTNNRVWNVKQITLCIILFFNDVLWLCAESMSVSVVHLSPYGSQISFANLSNRIETVTDWDAIAKKYRALQGASESDEREDAKASNASMEQLTRSNSEAQVIDSFQAQPQLQIANNVGNNNQLL